MDGYFIAFHIPAFGLHPTTGHPLKKLIFIGFFFVCFFWERVDNNSQINVKRACNKTADVLINLMLDLREIIVSHTNISAQNKNRGNYGSTCGFS